MYHLASNEEEFLLDTSSNSQDFYSESCVQQMNLNRTLKENNFSSRTSGYKHVPHSEKPPQVVAKRNARERRRVQAVNNAFVTLRNVVPIHNTRGKRISKVKTLLYAIDYIRALNDMLHDIEAYEMIYCELPENVIDPPTNWAIGKDACQLNRQALILRSREEDAKYY